MRGAAAAAALLLAATLCACAAQPGVVLLPGAEGHPTGKLAVIDEQGRDEAVLDQGDSRIALKAHVTQRDVKAKPATPQEQALLDALPEKEARFTLRFASESSDIVPESAPEMARLRAEVARRGPGVDVEVVGYTDAAGAADYNQRLSVERACGIRDALVAGGVFARAYAACSGRGSLDPVAPNGPDGHEALNRRVEVVVR